MTVASSVNPKWIQSIVPECDQKQCIFTRRNEPGLKVSLFLRSLDSAQGPQIAHFFWAW